jgi:hypothetical protein
MQGVDCCTYHLILQISTKLKNAGLGSKVEFVNFLIGVIACEMQPLNVLRLVSGAAGRGCYIIKWDTKSKLGRVKT